MLNGLAPAWAQLVINPVAFSTSGQDRIMSATADAQGRVYLLGYCPWSWSTGQAAPAIRTATGSVPMPAGGTFVAVYGATGQLERMRSVGGSDLRSLAVDAAGNVYVTGRDSQYTFFLAKYSPTLDEVWRLTYGTSAGAVGNKVLVDAQGSVYVAGTVQNWSIFGLVIQQYACCPENDFLVKVTPQGKLDWVRAGLNPNANGSMQSWGNSLAFDRAGNVVLVGTITGRALYGTVELAASKQQLLAVKYSPTGAVLWARNYGSGNYNQPGLLDGHDVALDEHDNVYICGSTGGNQVFGALNLPASNSAGSADALLLKLSPGGEPLWVRAGGYNSGTTYNGGSSFTSLAYRAGKLKATGYRNQTFAQYDSQPIVASYDAAGTAAWTTELGPGNVGVGTKILIDADQTSHVFGYFKNTVQLGRTSFASYGQEDGFYAQVLDASRYNLACTIRGTVYHDANRDCQPGAKEARVAGVIMEARPGPYYGITDSLGNYAIATDTGRYTVRQLLAQRPGHLITPTCPASGVSRQLHLPLPGISVTDADFGDELPSGPYLVASVAAGRRRRCAPGTTVVTYGNQGVEAATGTQLFVKLPRYVVLKSASLPYVRRADSTYVFAVGRLAPDFTGTLTIQDSVVCGNPGIMGLTVCTQAWLTPGTALPAPTAWNQASLSLRGAVQAGNEVRFALRNTGPQATTDSLALRIFQNDALALTHRFALPAGDSLVLRVPATGPVVRLEADQPTAHPLGPLASATVEVPMLRPPGGAHSAAMASRPPQLLPPNVAEECLPIVNSFDPNDKQVVPAGVTARHYTPTNTPLHYQVRFQNTGTDAAYRVVVVDTLAANLDISTLQVGAGSHPFRLRVAGKVRPVLTFTFDPINLPDSAHNEAGSMGFVQFSIQPKAGLPDYTEITNQAAIYFDYNPPIITNLTHNNLHDLPPVVAPAAALSYPAVLASPTVLAFSPGQGRAGTVVTLTGRRFAPTAAGNQVYFNGLRANVLSASTTSLTVRVPAGTSPGRLKVVTPDGAGPSGIDFVAYLPPTLNTVAPAEAVPGAVVTLTGTHFSPLAAQDTVTFGGVPALVRQATATTLQVVVPTGATLGKIQLKTLGGQVESAQDFQVWYPPVVAGLSPGKGRTGSIITLVGSNFAATPARNSVMLGGGAATVLQASATSLRVQVPATAASGPVRVQTPGGTAASSGDFTFIPPPSLVALAPAQGSVGTLVTLTGQHFGADGQMDTVSFGGVRAVVLSATPTTLVARVPKGAQSGPLLVAGAGGRAQASTLFEVLNLTPADAITVYPNPAHTALTVDWQRADFVVEAVRTYDALGRLLATQSLSDATQTALPLSFAGRVAGLYVVVVQTSRGIVTKHVTIY